MKIYLLFDFILILLFGVYLLSCEYVDYPKSVRIMVSLLYLILAIMRLILIILKNIRSEK